jgi:hypothetical protein
MAACTLAIAFLAIGSGVIDTTLAQPHGQQTTVLASSADDSHQLQIRPSTPPRASQNKAGRYRMTEMTE